MAFMNVGSTGKLSPHFSILKSQPHPHHIQLRYDHKVLILLHEDEVLEESVQELQLVYLISNTTRPIYLSFAIAIN